MSTPAEKIAAQKAAFEHQPSEHWHRHLVGPAELETLMENFVVMGCDLLNARQVIAMLLRYVHDDAGSMEAKRHAIKRAREILAADIVK